MTMKLKCILVPLLLFLGTSCTTNEKEDRTQHGIQIEWVDNLPGDFSFTENWSYKEGIYRNRKGVLRLDSGMIPLEMKEVINRMKDENGEVYKDSLNKYYQTIDTTHIFQSIESEAKVYENTSYEHFEFKKTKTGTIKGKTINNVSGYSHLHIQLENDLCYAWNDYRSIFGAGNHIFYLKKGRILIDKSLYRQGIIKAKFDFSFDNTLDADKELSWKGKIYSKIQTE